MRRRGLRWCGKREAFALGWLALIALKEMLKMADVTFENMAAGTIETPGLGL